MIIIDDKFRQEVTESQIADTVQPKNNIICVQCLFRNLLASTQLNIGSQIISSRLRRGLDFEAYYQVDGETTKRLLGSRILATNIKDITPVSGDIPIIDILSGIQPFAAFLTDAQGDRITDNVLSPKSENILRRRNAQMPGFSVYRFSFMSAGYSCVWHDMFASALDHEVYDPGRIIVKLSGGRPAGLIVTDERGEEQPISLDEVQQIKPFIMSGYWNRIVFDPSEDHFKVSGSDVVKTAIPAISKRSFYQTGMVRKLEDVDNARMLGFLETVVGKALTGDSSGSADLRVTHKGERAQRTPVTRKQKMVTRWMREQDTEHGSLAMEDAPVNVPPNMRRLLFEGCEEPSDNS